MSTVSSDVPASPSAAPPLPDDAGPGPGAHRNEVVLVGRVSAEAQSRDLPSGDRLLTLRVVVDRPPVTGSTRRTVDVIDVACWTTRTQRAAGRLVAGDGVRVEGALRRRFFAGAAGRASRYEVEAGRLTRVSSAAAS
ncbi:single-stranded DNA-binding protein [Nocardioides aurantiacus]|uniref:Single-strand DNA-binding protein n=1 Tax=Nocardioides aurantiacus TaxID=86796 RepID=A0A3N2CQ49_9ACTN|nr:single-stranded DNA-binding protein [Nocardioides aurantiacus]ROR89651.1 single-strand DNA-binding protein [Nocardioides aurantiacus]